MFRVCNIKTIAGETVADTVIQGELNDCIIRVKRGDDGGKYTFTCLMTADDDGNYKLCYSITKNNPNLCMLLVYDKIIELTYKYTGNTHVEIGFILDRFTRNRGFLSLFGPGLNMSGPEFGFICYIKTSVPLVSYKAWPDKGLEMCLWCTNVDGDIAPFPDGEIWKVSVLNSKLEIANPEVRDLMDANLPQDL